MAKVGISKCPLCSIEIRVAEGQRVYTCGKSWCRQERKRLNKLYVKRNGTNPEETHQEAEGLR